MWSSGDEQDPVSAYRYYATKRPHGFSRDSDPFYLAPRTTPPTEFDQWFLKQQVGIKTIGTLMKTMT
jgi:hypothetical protein